MVDVYQRVQISLKKELVYMDVISSYDFGLYISDMYLDWRTSEILAELYPLQCRSCRLPDKNEIQALAVLCFD